MMFLSLEQIRNATPSNHLTRPYFTTTPRAARRPASEEHWGVFKKSKQPATLS